MLWIAIRRLVLSLVAFLISAYQVYAIPSPQETSSRLTAPDDPPHVQINRTFPTPQPALSPVADWDRFRSSRQPDQILSSTIDNDHEDAGVKTPGGGGSYVGVYAVHTVYETGKFKLELPQNATRSQTLFAATTRPPNGACLEVGTAYTTDITKKETSVAVYVFDFCKPGKPNWGIPPFSVGGNPPLYAVDDTFMATYGRASIQGTPAYKLMILTKDDKPSSNSVWLAQLFNYKTNQWETMYQSTGLYEADIRGWSIFETWYQAGQCSENLPTLAADQLKFLNSATGAWEPARAHMSGLDFFISHGGSQNNNCFTKDHTGPASYSLGPDPPAYSQWRVASVQDPN
jgi:hypothetical protein